MNLKLVLKVVGRVLLIEAACLLLPALAALIYREDLTPFFLSAAITAAVGFALSRTKTKPQFFTREGFCTVGLIWLATGVVGALPFFFSGYFHSFIDCFFEAVSGFTTTGATILTDIESMPKGILFWRSFTHWLGGMGVLVLATALLPSMGIRSHYLTQAETPGPVFSKLVPKQSQTSKILYTIYCGLTLIQVVLLKLAGMPWYDAFIHALSTAGTGGFSNRNASVGAYGDPVIDLIISVFMLLFSVNFAMYFLLLTKRTKDILSSDELRFFLIVVSGATVLIAINILPIYGSIWQSLRYALFQVSSIISTTGFATADYMFWPTFSQTVLMLLLICGACAGSTGGGMKCSRVLLLMRCVRRELHRVSNPRRVEVIKLDGKAVEERTLHSTLVFVGCYFAIILGAALIVSIDNFSFSTSLTAAMTCVSNVGPGLDMVGPSGNFSAFSDLSKIVLSLCMITGRLEILPVLMLFSRTAWRKG